MISHIITSSSSRILKKSLIHSGFQINSLLAQKQSLTSSLLKTFIDDKSSPTDVALNRNLFFLKKTPLLWLKRKPLLKHILFVHKFFLKLPPSQLENPFSLDLGLLLSQLLLSLNLILWIPKRLLSSHMDQVSLILLNLFPLMNTYLMGIYQLINQTLKIVQWQGYTGLLKA